MSDEIGLRLLQKMGYKPGAGLGKDGSGITAPIEATMHAGRKGLGFSHEDRKRKPESPSPLKRRPPLSSQMKESSSSAEERVPDEELFVVDGKAAESAILSVSRFPELLYNLRLLLQTGGHPNRATEDLDLVREQVQASQRQLTEIAVKRQALGLLQACLERGEEPDEDLQRVLGAERCNVAQAAIVADRLKSMEPLEALARLDEITREPVRQLLFKTTLFKPLRMMLVNGDGLAAGLLPYLPLLDASLMPIVRSKLQSAIERAQSIEGLVELIPWLRQMEGGDLWPDWRGRCKILLLGVPVTELQSRLAALLPCLPEPEADRLLASCVLPRVEKCLDELAIDGERQEVKSLKACLRLAGLVPPASIHRLLVKLLFPKLQLFAQSWLQQPSADLSEVVAWYRAWRHLLPNEPVLRIEFANLLHLLNRLV